MNLFERDSAIELLQGQLSASRLPDPILPSQWIERSFGMGRGYAMPVEPGQVRLFPWQREPVNAITRYDVVILIGPVQTGKSMMVEGILGWKVDIDPTNTMIAYSAREVVEVVFDERLRFFVEEIPAIRKYWSGLQDDLTKTRIKLNHMVIRVAGAGIPKDIASFNAGFIIGDELAKWPKKKGFSPTKALRGRGQATRMLGGRPTELYCTSPRDDQDYSYAEAHKEGTLFLKAKQPCPHCGIYQELTDAQIREKPNRKGHMDHSPTRIRIEGAAWYECKHCRKEIPEEARLEMADRVIWAADTETITPDGQVIGRKSARRVVFNWNRLIDVTWSFSECLASYFEALNSANAQDLMTYQNEDMARWVKLFSKKGEESWLRAKCQKYAQYGPKPIIPDGVVILLCGIDTQDNGFFYVVRGFGKGMESWLIRHDFVACDMKDSRYQNRSEVSELLQREILARQYAKSNGALLPITFGLIDRGGHRSEDVDHFCQHNYQFSAYVGATLRGGPLIEQKKSGLYYGNSESLSRIVAKQMESEIWHLPKDVGDEYLKQVLNQYDEEFVDTRGNKKKRWVTGDDLNLPDHYRDCENLIIGAANLVNLHAQLFDDDSIKTISAAVEGKNLGESRETETASVEHESSKSGNSITNYLRQGGWAR